MKNPSRHFTRCLVAGIVALLPLGGAAIGIVWLENTISSSWRASLPFYFPGLGLLLAAVVIYAVGLFVTTFVGRWIWRRTDRFLEGLPVFGTFYQSLKQVLGYDTSRERFFQGVVLVRDEDGHELGLLTGESDGPEGRRSLVFVPGSPNPMAGKLRLIAPERLQRADIKVADALRALVSMGKAPLRAEP